MNLGLLYRVLGLPGLRFLLLVVGYSVGHEIADYLGREYRGGVSWGMTLGYQSWGVGLLSLVEGVVVYRWSRRWVRLEWLAATITAAIVLTCTGILTGYSGAWAHPYRLAWFQGCVVAAIFLPLIVHRLVNRWRHARAGRR